MKNGSNLISIAEHIAKLENFTNPNYIGKGAFKEVFSVIDSFNNEYALKIIQPNKMPLDRLKREFDALNKINHPNFCKILKTNNLIIAGIEYFYIIEEFLGGGTLTNKLSYGSLTLDETKKLGYHLTQSIGVLSMHHLVHRDIKPDNIMFRQHSEIPILVDFGLIRNIASSSLTQTWVLQGPGTPFFASPEQLNNDKYLISWLSDQFSLGIVLAFCLIGKHIYGDTKTSENEIVNNVVERRGVTPEHMKYFSEIKFGALLKMVEPWPISRYQTIENLLTIF